MFIIRVIFALSLILIARLLLLLHLSLSSSLLLTTLVGTSTLVLPSLTTLSSSVSSFLFLCFLLLLLLGHLPVLISAGSYQSKREHDFHGVTQEEGKPAIFIAWTGFQSRLYGQDLARADLYSHELIASNVVASDEGFACSRFCAFRQLIDRWL